LSNANNFFGRLKPWFGLYYAHYGAQNFRTWFSRAMPCSEYSAPDGAFQDLRIENY